LVGRIVRILEVINEDTILFGKPEGKIPDRRSVCKWEEIIIEVRYEGVEWIQMAQYKVQIRVVLKTIMKLQFP